MIDSVGKIENVVVLDLGSEVAADALETDGYLYVNDVSDFNSNGGTATVLDEPLDFITVDASTLPPRLVLAGILDHDIPAGVAVTVFGREMMALVRVDEANDDAVWVHVPRTLEPSLREGVRGTDLRETCTFFTNDNGELEMRNVIAIPFQLSMDYLAVDLSELEDALEELNTVVLPALAADLLAAQADISTLNTVTIPAINADLATAQSDILGLGGDIAGLDTRLDTAEADINSSEAAIVTLNTVTIPALDSDITNLELWVAYYNGTIFPGIAADIAANDADIATLNTNLGTTNTNLATAQGQINTLNTVTIPGINSTLSSHTTSLSTLNGKFPITTTDITPGAITTPTMSANSINGDRILANTLNANKIIADSITSNEIGANAITANELAANSVVAAKILAGEIATSHMTANTINGDRILANTLNANKIVADSITANEIAANAITASELAANSVIAAKILAGEIATSHMTANAINGDRITANTLNASKIVSGSITTDRMTANSIDGDRITANTLNAAKIIAGSITSDRMTANTITGDRIQANTMDAAKIVTGSITTTQMTANTINADRLAVNTLNGDRIIANTIQGDRIIANTLSANSIIASTFVGYTITGAIVQTDSAGKRIVVDGANDILKFYSGAPSETINGALDPQMFAGVAGAVSLYPSATTTYGQLGRLDLFGGTTGGTASLSAAGATGVLSLVGAGGVNIDAGNLNVNPDYAVLSYANGLHPACRKLYDGTAGAYSSGTLTGMPLSVDGSNVVVNQRILVINFGGDPNAWQNGIYKVTTIGTGVNGVWDRAADALGNGVGTSGFYNDLNGAQVLIIDGAKYEGTCWFTTWPSPGNGNFGAGGLMPWFQLGATTIHGSKPGGVRDGFHPDVANTFASTTGSYTTTGGGTLSGMPNAADGNSTVVGMRIMVVGRTNAYEGGIYKVTTVGSGANGVWVRAEDANVATYLWGAKVYVAGGTVYGGTRWMITTQQGTFAGSWVFTNEGDTGWIALPLSANYQIFAANYSVPAYRRIGDMVQIRGLVTRNTSTAAANSSICQMPVGFRPQGLCIFEQHISGGRLRLDVYPITAALGTPGIVTHTDVALAVGGYCSLDGVYFSTT